MELCAESGDERPHGGLSGAGADGRGLGKTWELVQTAVGPGPGIPRDPAQPMAVSTASQGLVF